MNLNSLRHWRVRRAPAVSFLRRMAAVLSPAVATALYHRGLRRVSDIKAFLEPSFDDARQDFWLLPDMKKAVARLKKARQNQEKIGVFGDYDADGVSGTALLLGLMDALGLKAQHYLPDREHDGYGLKKAALKEFADSGVRMVISVDCGTSNVAEVVYANQLGLDVIILDHHEAPTKLPPAVAVVNPKRLGSRYPFRDLSGTGVAFEFAAAVEQTLRAEVKFPTAWLKWQLDLVALATVADRMPLLGLNRILVTFGLKVLSKTRRPGLRALVDVCGLTNRKLTATDVGFALAPRLNAAGRMDHANLALYLLRSHDPAQAHGFAVRLQEQNQARQRLVERLVREIVSRQDLLPRTPELISAIDQSWPKGVLGIVASKLVERYQRPALVAQKGAKETVASGRSLAGYDLIAGIKRQAKLLLNFGGHTFAAGLTVGNKNYSRMIKNLEQDVLTHRAVQPDAATEMLIDAEVKPEDLKPALFKDTLKLGPFGDANPVPLFLLKGASITQRRLVGQNKNHLQFFIEAGEGIYKAMAFNGARSCPESVFKPGTKVDIVFEPMVNEWQGQEFYELRIIDLRIAV